MSVRITRNRRVVCRSDIELPLSAGAVWGQLRDPRGSARHDPFHAKITVHGNVPRVGATVTLVHRHFLFQTVRTGRILRWEEGSGFAFSDLHRDDPQRAFPHVLSYQVQPTGEQRCRLIVRVGGRWTAPLPRWIGWLWLTWVFSHIVRTVRNQLLAHAVAMRVVRWRMTR